ncbi:hypothetical protein LXL04_005741 [Taraxacum kok-saghyz]
MEDLMADYTTDLRHLCDDQIQYKSSRSPNEDVLSKFLATLTTQHSFSEPESDHGMFVFWSQNLPSQNNPDSGDLGLVHNAIKSAFSKVDLCYFDGFIQFWAPVEAGGKSLLTTYDQPFAVQYLNSGIEKYRLCSLSYQYNIDASKLEVEDVPFIINGAVANAFLNHLAEVVLDLRVHHGSPLALSALACEFICSFLLPICDPSQSRCVGVVECCATKLDHLFKIFNDLNRALKVGFNILLQSLHNLIANVEITLIWVIFLFVKSLTLHHFQEVGLCTFHGQERLPYERSGGLKYATDEIEEALHRVCESHDLTLAQLRISYEDGNRVACSTSLEDTRIKQIIPLKLIAYCDNSDDEDRLSFKDYYDICDMLPLKIGEGHVDKALQNYEPHLCRYINDTSNNEPPELFPITVTERSCFVIYLRSTETGNLDYVLEFLWIGNRNYIILLESLILTLKKCLPNFKFASGSEFGDELHVLDFKFASRGQLTGYQLSVQDFSCASDDVYSFSKKQIEYFKIFEGKKSSPQPTVLEKERRIVVAQDFIVPSESKCKITEKPSLEDIKQQFGSTMKQAAKNLNVSVSTLKRKCKVHGISEWQGPNFVNKKESELYDIRSGRKVEDNEVIQGPRGIDGDTLTIKAEYEDDMIKFHLPISLSTFEAVEKEIGKRFKLKVTTYKLKYLDEDKEWILMTCDQDMTDCIKSSKSVNVNHSKLCVLRST